MIFKYIIYISICFIVTHSMFDYGEFDIALTKCEMCNGPKRKNCVELTVKIINGTFLKCDLLVKEDMKVIKGKIIGSVDGTELLRLQIKNVCKHIFFRPLFQSLLNETKRCGIFKGHHIYDTDVQTIARNFYGGKFMYGNWTLNIAFYNDQCNLYCGKLYVSLNPKISAIGDKQ